MRLVALAFAASLFALPADAQQDPRQDAATPEGASAGAGQSADKAKAARAEADRAEGGEAPASEAANLRVQALKAWEQSVRDRQEAGFQCCHPQALGETWCH